MLHALTVNGITFTPTLVNYSTASRTMKFGLGITAPGVDSWGCTLLVKASGHTNLLGARPGTPGWASLEEAVRALLEERAAQVKVETRARLGNVRAARLHRVLDGLGLSSGEHFEVASRALGVIVESFAALHEGQFTRLWGYICDRWPWAEAEASAQGLAA